MIKKYARVLPDKHWWKDPNGDLVTKSRHQDWDFNKNFRAIYPYPAVIGLRSSPKGGTGQHRSTVEHWELVHGANTPGAMFALRRLGAGLWNITGNRWIYTFLGTKYMKRKYNTLLKPQAQAIACVGAYVKVLEVRNGSARIEVMSAKGTYDSSPQKHPHLWFKFKSIAINGELGNAPEGEECWIPLVSSEEAWLPLEALEFLDEIPTNEEEKMTITRAHGVDVSGWQAPYKDDGIDEGLDIKYVIQKFGQGYTGYFDGVSSAHENWWKEQYISIKSFRLIGGYFWVETELDPFKQADVVLGAYRGGLYDFVVLDFEAYQNTIDLASVTKLKRMVEYLQEKEPEIKVLFYSNFWIYDFLAYHYPAFAAGLEFWYAGGIYYNRLFTGMFDDSLTPVLPSARKDWTLWQISADGNQAADEADFGTDERSSIDINIFNGTWEEMKVWAGVKDAIVYPPTEADCSHEQSADDLESITVDIRRVIDSLRTRP